MEQLMNAVLERLASGVPELRFVGQDTGQSPVEFPCALADIAEIDFKTLLQGKQRGNTRIEITLCFSASENEIQEQCFTVIKKVYGALQGMSGEYFTGLNRRKLQRDKERYPFAYILSFDCVLDDCDAMPELEETGSQPDIDIK